MNKKTGIIAAVVIVIALGAWYYFSTQTPAAQEESSEAATGTQETSNNNPAPVGGMETGELPAGTDVNGGASVNVGVTANAVKSFTVTGSNFSFAPNSISVKKGDHVQITFKNADGTHDFRIDEFNVATSKIGSGQSASVEFVASKTGSFQYYCSVGNHRAMGMWGTLVVTE